VGVIGVSTPTTPQITSDVGLVVFHAAAPAVAAAVDELHSQGVDKIVVLSHLGYEQDIQLAQAVPGIDAIVGGHSHTLLGDPVQLGQLGLAPSGPYPTEVSGPDGGRVLVVQAWRWGMQLGVLRLTFDAAGGISGSSARPLLLAGADFVRDGKAVPKGSPEQARLVAALTASGAARVVAGDPGLTERLEPYARQLDAFRNARINARASVDLIRGTATDPGPLVADAYLARAPGAQLALLMPGGLRQDLFQGELTLGMVMGVLPFGNSLVTLDVSGAEFRRALEEAAEFRLTVHPPTGATGGVDWSALRVFHAAGFTCTVDPAQPLGSRIGSLRVRRADGGFAEIDPAARYRLVTNSYLANGGDGLATLKSAQGSRVDTGYLEHDVFSEHLTALGLVKAPDQGRVVVREGGADPAPVLAPVPGPVSTPIPGPIPGPVSCLPSGLGLGQAA
jgi:5'-nucleotidase/UDP-sugar diphosphatase